MTTADYSNLPRSELAARLAVAEFALAHGCDRLERSLASEVTYPRVSAEDAEDVIRLFRRVLGLPLVSMGQPAAKVGI